ncbi:MAG: methylmalonyl Co-A mutase-associated GTPase MeaB [Acidimicrobiia bacterium]
MSDVDVAELAAEVRRRDRRALARAITLVESTRADHQRLAEEFLAELLPHTGAAVRIGVSGTPGVGKSTFIEALGTMLTARGHDVAVLAVDPSSKRSGGSILGDKTRMEDLARDPRAFIRPSPSSGTLGGVARRTREAMLVCEAAGFDVVLVETVGVGQSETAVADMVDLFVLLLAPGGGDELQGIKRGIMELADIVVVNKADGDLTAAARAAASEYRGALGFMRPRSLGWQPEVFLVSSVERSGLAEVWDAVVRARDALVASGEWPTRRAEQAGAEMWREVGNLVEESLRSAPEVAAMVADLDAGVRAGRVTPSAAARRLLEAFRAG